jgi:hypothetical protein
MARPKNWGWDFLVLPGILGWAAENDALAIFHFNADLHESRARMTALPWPRKLLSACIAAFDLPNHRHRTSSFH